jgi:beta-lactamase regulating signal transducer with metallopeptidase domain/protocatechuate 3,4-dioxygenase beta subunit
MSLPQCLETALVERLGWCLVHSVWQGAAIGLVTAFVLRALRGKSAQARYLTACGALAAMAIFPLATFTLLAIEQDGRSKQSRVTSRSLWEPRDGNVRSQRGDDLQQRAPEAAGGRGIVQSLTPPAKLSASLEPLLPWAVGVWGFGVFGLSLRLLAAWMWVQWLAWSGTRPVTRHGVELLALLMARLRINQRVRLLESPRLQVPLAVGWLRPVIILPLTALTGLPSDQLGAILAHELAHVRRYDYLVNLAQSVIDTLLFYHPAAWWISGRIRAEREHCCDDLAVQVCGDRLAYVRALAAIEEQRKEGWLLAPSARDGSLLVRIRRLLGVAPSFDRRAGGLAGALALVAVVSLVFAFVLTPPTNQARAGVTEREVLTGTIVDAGANPVPGADVWLVTFSVVESKTIVLGSARSGVNGRFRLVAIEEGLKLPDLGWRAIYAHKPGKRPAALNQADAPSELGFSTETPMRLTLGDPGSADFTLADASGKSVAGVSVAIRRLDGVNAGPPDELVERLTARTGPDGRVALRGVPLDQIRELRVFSSAFGDQSFYAHNGFKSGELLRLRNAVPVSGRVIADDPAQVRGLPVYLSTLAADFQNLTGHRAQGEAWAVTDERGQFRVSALANGTLSASVRVPSESQYRAPWIRDRDFKAAARIDIEIPLKRMVRVHGFVYESGTKKPIEGVGVGFSSPELIGSLQFVLTDPQGRYETLALPGSTSYLHLKEPKSYIRQGRGVEKAIAEEDDQSLAPVELEVGASLGGSVVDEEGKPVARAAVEGKWDKTYPLPGQREMALGRTFSATATTDAQGRFLLEGIHPGASVMLEANAGDARTGRPTSATAGSSDAKLMISGANTVALIGRVVDVAGKPVASALVQIRSRPVKRDGQPEGSPIRFDVGEIRTDQDGRFTTPRQLRRGYGYRAEVKPAAEDLMPENTPWLALMSQTRAFLPKLVLRRLRTIRGRVIDSRQRPVAEASVRQAGDGPSPTATVTDSEGRFALAGVLAEPAFVFVAKDGFRFEGKPIAAADAVVDVTLSRVDESYPQPVLSRESPLPRAEELAILHRVFDEYAELMIKDGTAQELFEVVRVLIWLDPARATELLADKRLGPWQPGNLRLSLAVRLVQQSDEQARKLIDGIEDANLRSYAYSEASAALPDTERGRKLDLLNRSLIAGRAVVDEATRVLRLADIGGRLFDIGQTEQATKLVREAQAIAVKLGTTGTSAWARGRLAEELVQVDIPAALQLLEGMETERGHDQFLGRMAHELARQNPAEAERLLMLMRDVWPHFRDAYTERVCYRMVTVDPQRAIALAARMTNYRHRARALGGMALALAKTKGDRQTAVRLLGEAFDVLDQAVTSRNDDWDGLGMACTAAAGLLPIVEQIDVRLLPQYLWRTLALRPPIPGPNGRDGISDIANARVAAMASRFDVASARHLWSGFAGRALAHRIGLEDWGSMYRDDSIIEAAAVVDPAQTAAMIDSLPDSSGPREEGLKNRARLAVARILARPPDERSRYLERNLLHLWPIDAEED